MYKLDCSVCFCVSIQTLSLSLQTNAYKYSEIIAHTSNDTGSCCHNYQSVAIGKYFKEHMQNSPTSQQQDGPLSQAPSPVRPT
jgi:hypothetical protein